MTEYMKENAQTVKEDGRKEEQDGDVFREDDAKRSQKGQPNAEPTWPQSAWGPDLTRGAAGADQRSPPASCDLPWQR